MAPKILIVLTSHAKIEGGDFPTGWWLPEFAHPFYKLKPHFDLTIASPTGGESPLNPWCADLYKEDAESMKFLKEEESWWKNTEKLKSFLGKSDEFAGVYFVGGHGPMFDLPTDPQSQQLIREFYEAGKVVSAVCHGPAVFLHVKLSDGSLLIANQAVTGLSDAEELPSSAEVMPFSLEKELQRVSGGKFQCAPKPEEAFVVVSGKDGKLITGQNPNSAAGIAEAIRKSVFG